MRPRSQAGLILPALLVVLLFGAVAFTVGRYQQTLSVQTRQHLATVQALATARAALRDYAQSYPLMDHPDQTVGYLPCPDTDNDGSAEPICGSGGDLAIGRFPYRTLGILPIRDGHGECLWYVVAGTFKNNPKKSGDFNWDAEGQFIVRSADGRDLHAVDRPQHYAAALIIAPGAPLPNQNRSATGAPCNGDADSASAMPAFLEGSYPVTSTIPVVATQGEPGSTTNNDQIAWLAADDIFGQRLRHRDDFKAMIDGMLTDITAAVEDSDGLIRHPKSPITVGPIEEGQIPDEAKNELSKRWLAHLRFLRCNDASPCLTLDDGSACRAILLFAGAAADYQHREQSATDDNYFEDNMEPLADPELTFHGPSQFDADAASQDLARCLP